MKNNFKNMLFNSPGYIDKLFLNDKDLELFKFYINKQWFEKIHSHDKAVAEFINKNNLDIKNYHKVSCKLNHSKIWKKTSRVLPLDFLKNFYKTNLFKELNDLFGNFEISDEENFGFGNIYWRLVRPNENSDIGPLHRDSWFWELNKSFPRPEYSFERIKVWIAIETEPNKSGLLVEENSHKRKDILWKGEFRDGIKKPILLEENKKFNMKLVPTKPGDLIIFNDDLLHGGALNKSKNTRVSVEFTLITRVD